MTTVGAAPPAESVLVTVAVFAAPADEDEDDAGVEDVAEADCVDTATLDVSFVSPVGPTGEPGGFDAAPVAVEGKVAAVEAVSKPVAYSD